MLSQERSPHISFYSEFFDVRCAFVKYWKNNLCVSTLKLKSQRKTRVVFEGEKYAQGVGLHSFLLKQQCK